MKSVLFQTQVEAVGAGNVPDMSESLVSHAEGQHRDRRRVAHRATVLVLSDVVLRRSAQHEGAEGIQRTARNAVYRVSQRLFV